MLSDPLADTALRPAMVAMMAVRRASLGRLHLVGPSTATELESDVTGIFVTSPPRVSKEARLAPWQHCVCTERHLTRGTVGKVKPLIRPRQVMLVTLDK